MSMEREQWLFAIFLLMLLQESLIASSKSREVRAGMIHADRSLTCSLIKVGGENTVCTHQTDLLQALHLLHLACDVSTCCNKDGVVDEFGLACSDLG